MQPSVAEYPQMHGSPQPVVTSSPSSTYTELVPPNRQHVELSTLQQKVQEPQILTIEPLPKPNEPPQQFQGKLQTIFPLHVVIISIIAI